MRWLIIALMISISGLLLAAAGMARHILSQRRKLKIQPPEGDAVVVDAPETRDIESES